MKSFIVALILIVSVSVFVIWNSIYTVSIIDEMLLLTEALPKTAEEFRSSASAAAPAMNRLTALWDQKFPFIVFMSGYGNTDRCDTAIGALSVHFKNANDMEFPIALAEFRDGLKRLRILEGFHAESIF